LADYRRDLLVMLRENGCEFVRHANGSHDLWQSPINNRRFVVQQDIPTRSIANSILKQAGRPKSL